MLDLAVESDREQRITIFTGEDVSFSFHLTISFHKKSSHYEYITSKVAKHDTYFNIIRILESKQLWGIYANTMAFYK